MTKEEKVLIALINSGFVADRIHSRDDSEYAGWDWCYDYDRAESVVDYTETQDGSTVVEFLCDRGNYWILVYPGRVDFSYFASSGV